MGVQDSTSSIIIFHMEYKIALLFVMKPAVDGDGTLSNQDELSKSGCRNDFTQLQYSWVLYSYIQIIRSKKPHSFM